MWLAISLPALDSPHASGRLARLHAAVGDRLEPGSVLADVTIDLSAGNVRDCPPMTTCRIVMREGAWLREIRAAADWPAAAGSIIALLSTEPLSPRETPAREAQVTLAAVLHHEDWWAGPG